ncbi:hypothetical protein [Oenococcus sicerae]|uniref:hypothetical protein n=1 Tax=Oenococcus sicerae TaxID=2203724 RepID=UPI0010B6E749|nr:hypothetical protein OAL24_00626 [Oenococcus sicerae]
MKIPHAKGLFSLSILAVLLLIIFALATRFTNRPHLSLAKRDAAIILSTAVENRLPKKYLADGPEKTKADGLMEIKRNLTKNLLLSGSLTYDKKKYTQAGVLTRLAEKIYELIFTKRSAEVNKVTLNNTHTARVDYTIQPLNLQKVFDQLTSASQADLNQAKNKTRPTDLSQSQIALLQYILISVNWQRYLAHQQNNDAKIQSYFTIVFAARKQHYLITEKTLQFIQTKGVNNVGQ